MSLLVESLYHQLAYFTNRTSDVEIPDIVFVELYLQELARENESELFVKDANATNNETMMTLIQFENKVSNDTRLLRNFESLVEVYGELSTVQIQKRIDNIKTRLLSLYRKHNVQVFKDK